MARNLTPAERLRIKELRYVHGLSRTHTAAIVGCSLTSVTRHAPGRCVPVGIPAETVALTRRLRYVDGLTQEQAAARAGVSIDTVRYYAPGRVGKIDNAALRERFERSPLTAADVARAVGWTYERRGRPRADTSRVKRALGLQDDVSHGCRGRRVLIDAETAALIAEAIGVEPWEVGATDTMEHLAKAG